MTKMRVPTLEKTMKNYETLQKAFTQHIQYFSFDVKCQAY